jgi:predicted nucleotidyltransferase
MHPYLLQSLDRCVARFSADPRCLGLALHGSIGRGETDAYSDIDVGAVVEDEAYEAVKAEMPGLCAELFGPISIWLPEGERPSYCNFAFLFEHGSDLLLTDFELISRSLLVEWRHRPDRILFDRTGLLAEVQQMERPAPAFGDAQVAHLIDTYWVYAYLDGKYWRRQDLYKLLYVQQTLFQLHVRLLNLLRTGAEGSWWAGDVARFSTRDRTHLRAYFCVAGITAAARALARSIDLFADDARALCAVRGMDYPEAREQAVRRHLRDMGLPVN